MIPKDELEKLMEEERLMEQKRIEDARLINLEEKEECLTERQQGHKDAGMSESDFY